MQNEAPNEATPEWFDWALAQPPSPHTVDSGGTRIHYAGWNAHETGKPVLLFVHGFLGHAHWWDFIAPFFIERFRVFAIDFSGMGESEARSVYAPGCFVGDIAAVLRARLLDGPPATVVGHSFGGTRVLQACIEIPHMIGHAIVLDSMAYFEGDARPANPHRAGPRPCADNATMLSRFRLLPPQECEPYTLAHIAKHSLCRCDGGWTWCFDPMLRQLSVPGIDQQALRQVGMPVDYVHAGASTVVNAERAARICRTLPMGKPPITMADAGHHMMLDQPLALVDVLRLLLDAQRRPSSAPA